MVEVAYRRMAVSHTSRLFGVLQTGEPVEAWTLTGAGGLVLETITYGGIVTRLLAPDAEGVLADVVLGYNRLEAYVDDRCYFGAITGRVAGRITDACFELDGKLYELPANEAPNHLHGGVRGFNKQMWKAVALSREDGAPSLRLTRTSPGGEEGYPGTVEVTVTYTVTDENVFLIETEAITNKATPLSLTHHSYFNLAGTGSIADHFLQIDADGFAPTDTRMALLGHVEPVYGKGNDFRVPRRMGDAIPGLFQEHGDFYRLRRNEGDEHAMVKAARLIEPKSGRVLDVRTTEDWMQMYTAAALDGTLVGKSGVRYARYAGICLECHRSPDAMRTPAMGQIVLRPGMVRRTATAYAFSCLPRV